MAQTIPLGEYRNLLQEYETATKQPISPDAARSLDNRLKVVNVVTLPDGSSVVVDTKPLRSPLAPILKSRSAVKIPKAEQRLIVTALELTERSPAAPSANAEDQAKAIINTREFRDAIAKKPPRTWFDDIGDWINDQLDKLWRWLFGNKGPRNQGGPDFTLLAQIVQAILILFAIVVVSVGIYYLVRWVVFRLPSARTRRPGVISGLDLTESALPDPLGSSRELAARGDYRGALRLAYIACLRRLAASGLLILQENRTNWEYQRALRGKSRLAYDALLPATRLFDGVWYGQRPATPDEYAAVVAAHEQLEKIEASQTKRPSNIVSSGEEPEENTRTPVPNARPGELTSNVNSPTGGTP